MKFENLQFLLALIKEHSGIVLSQEKAYLLESRLMPVIKKWDIKNLDSLCEAIRKKRDRNLTEQVVEAMTTNESFFFRDKKPFETLKNYIVPQLVADKMASRRLRIWSAAASTGQEPYSLAITLNEMSREFNNLQFEILATDISNEALSRARLGKFSQFEIQRGLTSPQLIKYFQKINDEWEVKSDIKRYLKFEQHNLLMDNKKFGKFDIIFIRNVLIYFDNITKKKVLEAIASVLNSGGYICLGGTETILGITEKLLPCENCRGWYQAIGNVSSTRLSA